MSLFQIRDFSLTVEAGTQTMTATVDGEPLFVTVPGELSIVPRAELFLGTALLPAMHERRDIVIADEMPVSPRLMRNLEIIQRLFKQWSPGLWLINIKARIEAPQVLNELVSCSYSGGIDSSCSLARHDDDITHLMTATGFDVSSDIEDDLRPAQLQDWTRSFGKAPMFVRSNLRRFSTSRSVSWERSHGSAMASLMAGLCVRRHYLPSSYTFRELKPWGSHPLLDPLWSTEATELIHDAPELRRSEKTELIAKNPAMLEHLQVCWKSAVSNCGVCSKCVRTRVVLDMLGRRGPFPDVPFDFDVLKPHGDLSAAFVWDIREFARERGHPKIAAKMQRLLNAYLRRRSLDSFARALIGPAGERLYRRFRPGRLQGRLVFEDPDNFK